MEKLVPFALIIGLAAAALVSGAAMSKLDKVLLKIPILEDTVSGLI